MPPDHVHVAASCPIELADSLRARAAAEDRTVSAELRLALREHLGLTSKKRPRPERVGASKTAGRGRNGSE